MLDRLPSYNALLAHAKKLEDVHVRSLFREDSRRYEELHLEAGGWLFDFSKHRVTRETLAFLASLAREAGVEKDRDRMFRGEPINVTEHRAVLHVALRRHKDEPILVDGKDIVADVEAVRASMRAFVNSVANGEHRGYSGKPITTVVNIGIGGSDLGPGVTTDALRPYWRKGFRAFFVSNLDVTHLLNVLRDVDPETTLFTIASKTFTTQETMSNAKTARQWLLDHAKNEAHVDRHFVALSTNREAVKAFGISRMFPFWDWVGGRFSLWSSIGLPVALAVGWETFLELLEGARTIDRHFVEAPIEKNVPMMMALLGVWCTNFLGAKTHAILPYDQSLVRLPAFLQQGEMESNGKRISRTGELLRYPTAPILWGEPGTNGQHAFYQLLHQGTHLVPIDFIVALEGHHGYPGQHEKLVANCFAQAEAFMRGRTSEEADAELRAKGLSVEAIAKLSPHKVFPGNRPSSMFVTNKLTPRTIGELIALYEHKIFCQGILWDVPSFDQWGVELGKELASQILAEFRNPGAPAAEHDESTAALIARYLAHVSKGQFPRP